MQIGRTERIRMERAHVNAWPALQSHGIDGWLWRASGGGSQRANSVSTIDFTGNDPEAAIDAVEERYRAEGLPCRFQVFDETKPTGLSDRLERRGYGRTEATLTLFKRPSSAGIADAVERRGSAWDEWRSVYLGEISESRRTVNALILERIPQPAAFFAAILDGHVAATALCAIHEGCAVVECVATQRTFRRRGAARAVMAALGDWASEQGCDLLGLQVVASNTAALALYQGLGFQPGAQNMFWMKS